MASLAEEKRRQRDYLDALEEEQRKLLVFSRELPLSLELITQAIENFRRGMGGENASGNGPVLEEFIPLRSGTSSSGIEESIRGNWRSSDTKPCRLASVHLRASAAAEAFHASNLGELKQTTTTSNLVGVDAKRVRGAFRPFQRDVPEPATPGLSMKAMASSSTMTENIAAPTEAGRDNGEDDNDKQPQGFPQPNRKQRRCWSAYLHRKFLCALEELGGSKRATPKQIRELMKVDGLTNDEIKSHLQKFRLHTRRPVTTVHSSSTSGDGPAQTPPHQFLVVGGIWVPPAEYAAAEGCSAASKGSCSHVSWLSLELGLLQEQHDKKQRIVKSPSRPLGFHEGCTHDDDCPVNEAEEKSKSSSTSSSSLATITSRG